MPLRYLAGPARIVLLRKFQKWVSCRDHPTKRCGGTLEQQFIVPFNKWDTTVKYLPHTRYNGLALVDSTCMEPSSGITPFNCWPINCSYSIHFSMPSAAHRFYTLPIVHFCFHDVSVNHCCLYKWSVSRMSAGDIRKFARFFSFVKWFLIEKH